MRAGLSVRPRVGAECSSPAARGGVRGKTARPVASLPSPSSPISSRSTTTSSPPPSPSSSPPPPSPSSSSSSSPLLLSSSPPPSPSLRRPSVRASATSGTPGHLRPKELLEVALKAADAGADVSFSVLFFSFQSRIKHFFFLLSRFFLSLNLLLSSSSLSPSSEL